MINIFNYNSGIYAIIHGRVQGVYFRANTKKMADTFGIHGWVRNLSDGTVEVMAFGAIKQLKNFSEWLKLGPDRAVVETVDICKINYNDKFKSFDIL